MPAALRTLVTRPCLVIAVADPILFGVWTGVQPRPEDVTAVMSSALSYARSVKQCAMLIGIPPAQPLPTSEVRDAIQTEMRKLDPYMICGATVLTRDGFLGTAMRAVVSTLQLLSRPTHPEKIFGSSREASLFLHETLANRIQKAPSADTIAATYEDLTRKLWNKAAA